MLSRLRRSKLYQWHNAGSGRREIRYFVILKCMPTNKFLFATGIENSYPVILLPGGKTKRVDEMEKTGHYQNWQQDFELVKDMGIQFLRYGPPYYSTHLGPGKYDWSFTDATFNKLKELGITPIVDLCHF